MIKCVYLYFFLPCNVGLNFISYSTIDATISTWCTQRHMNPSTPKLLRPRAVGGVLQSRTLGRRSLRCSSLHQSTILDSSPNLELRNDSPTQSDDSDGSVEDYIPDLAPRLGRKSRSSSISSISRPIRYHDLDLAGLNIKTHLPQSLQRITLDLAQESASSSAERSGEKRVWRMLSEYGSNSSHYEESQSALSSPTDVDHHIPFLSLDEDQPTSQQQQQQQQQQQTTPQLNAFKFDPAESVPIGPSIGSPDLPVIRSKRKMTDDRYDPYTMHKRRALSPASGLSSPILLSTVPPPSPLTSEKRNGGSFTTTRSGLQNMSIS